MSGMRVGFGADLGQSVAQLPKRGMGNGPGLGHSVAHDQVLFNGKGPAMSSSNSSPTSASAMVDPPVTVTFGQKPTHPAVKRALENVFFPKTIALVGASPEDGTIGRNVMENIVKSGYDGTIYPINPKHGGKKLDWAGDKTQPFVKSTDDLPANTVDMAVIMTPAKTVPGVIRSLGAKGVTSVVVISAGFNEVGGDGSKLEEDLNKALAETGIKMIGPNCVGVASTSPTGGMNASFANSTIAPGKGAIMSQSGAVSIDLFEKARLAGLGFSQMASIGNQTNVDAAQLMKHWQDDTRVNYILGYLEAIKDPAAFRAVATEVSKTKPIVLIKSGRSEAGARAASSHTGSLAGSDTAVEALFEQSGVQRVNSLEELFNVAKAFELAPPVKGNRVGVISNSGGFGVMVADTMESAHPNLKMANLTDETRARLKTLLPPTASNRNPIDTIATTPSDTPDQFKLAIKAMADDANVDAVVVPITPLLRISATEVAKAIAAVQATTTKPVIGSISVSEQDLLKVQEALQKEGIKVPPLYRNLDDALLGLSALEKHHRWSSKPAGQAVAFADIDRVKAKAIVEKAKAEGRTLLTTTESLNLIEAYGIRTAPHHLVGHMKNGHIDRAAMKYEILQKAEAFGYPAAIKLVSNTITHKTEVGGVAFDLKTPEALGAALDKMLDSIAKAGVTRFAPGEGIMVQKSIPNGRESLIGLKVDDTFGPMIAFGLGGIYVEVFKDVKFRNAPLTRDDVKEMVSQIKGHKILAGYRGKAGVDFDTLEETILRFSQLATDFPEIIESDLNPFFAQPKGDKGEKGGVAVDARFALKGNVPGDKHGHGKGNTVQENAPVAPATKPRPTPPETVMIPAKGSDESAPSALAVLAGLALALLVGLFGRGNGDRPSQNT